MNVLTNQGYLKVTHSGGVSSVSWGDITGTITDQTDLISYIAGIDSGVVHLAGNETITGHKTFSADVTLGTTLYDVTNNRISFSGFTGSSKINLPNTGTSSADGINFGSGSIYRESANTIRVDSSTLRINNLSITDSSQIFNATTSNRGSILFANSGLQLQHNLNNSNPAVSITNLHASATGNILNLSNNGGVVAFVNISGAIQSLYQRFGSGSPEGVVAAPVGAYYSRTDGGAGTSFYVKESGSGNTGWIAK